MFWILIYIPGDDRHVSVNCGAHVKYGKGKGPQTCSLHCKI